MKTMDLAQQDSEKRDPEKSDPEKNNTFDGLGQENDSTLQRKRPFYMKRSFVMAALPLATLALVAVVAYVLFKSSSTPPPSSNELKDLPKSKTQRGKPPFRKTPLRKTLHQDITSGNFKLKKSNEKGKDKVVSINGVSLSQKNLRSEAARVLRYMPHKDSDDEEVNSEGSDASDNDVVDSDLSKYGRNKSKDEEVNKSRLYSRSILTSVQQSRLPKIEKVTAEEDPEVFHDEWNE